MTDLGRIASAMGGEVRGNSVAFPSPGHSKHDRGTVATLDPNAPDGLLVHSFNGADPLAIKDELRAKGVLPGREQAGEAWRCTGTFDFRDEAGALLYRTRRLEHPRKPKRYEAELPCGGKKIGDVRRVLYRLPELLAADPAELVYLVEGERKADKLAAMGFTATSIAFGANAWRECYARALAGRTVAILADNDAPGRKFAETARDSIEAAGGRAHLVELPGLPPAGDIIDWRGTADDLRELTARALAGGGSGKLPAWRRGITAAALMAKRFEPIRFVAQGYIAEGLTVLAGAPKARKSWMMLDVAHAVASGGDAFGSVPCEHGDVLYLALEDNERRLKGRLSRMGVTSPPERLTFCTQWPTGDDAVAEIEAWARAADNPTLVVVDVLARVREFTGREASYEADYRALTGLQALATRLGIAIVAIHHTRKMAADDPFDEVSGTRGLTGAADTVLVLARDNSGGPSYRATLYGRGRDIAEIETALEFCDGDCRWRVLGDAHEVASTGERQAVLDLLRRTGEAMTPTEVADILDKSRPNVAKMLARMLTAGQVTKPAAGRYRVVTPVTLVTPPRGEGGQRVTSPVAVVTPSMGGRGQREASKTAETGETGETSVTAVTSVTTPGTVTGIHACPRCAGVGCDWCGDTGLRP